MSAPAPTAHRPVLTHRVPFLRAYFPAVVYTQVGLGIWLWCCYALVVAAGSGGVDDVLETFALAHAFYCLTVPVFLVAPAVFVWVRLAAVRVTAGGLTAPLLIGFTRTAAWDEIVAVRRVPIPGFPLLRVRRRGRRLRLWVPLAVRGLTAMAVRAERYTRPDHPFPLAVRAWLALPGKNP